MSEVVVRQEMEIEVKSDKKVEGYVPPTPELNA